MGDQEVRGMSSRTASSTSEARVHKSIAAL